MSADIRRYAIVTAGYWGFTLTDGALRMLVLLHFHTLGYTPFELALLFLLYELAGMATNLAGGWVGARFGLKLTLHLGLALQIAALGMLALLDPAWPLAWSVAYVVAAQGLAGVAKDLTKMSAKSAIKLVVPSGQSGRLFRWVALLTGSKNALKGVGFFIGGALLAAFGFESALWIMAGGLGLVLLATLIFLTGDLGRMKSKPGIGALLAKSAAVNRLSAARFFLFGARDTWFVVGVPVFLYDVLGWSFEQVGGFLALWIIGYGAVQAAAPALVRRSVDGTSSEVGAARLWAFILALLPAGLAFLLTRPDMLAPDLAIILGLGLFGLVFAINSALHSYLILAYADAERVALDVGFYYMANAGGRLLGTLLSGLAYQAHGIAGCLLIAALLVGFSWLLSLRLPRTVST
ncbi:organoarsenical effux MFS transporter ArsJ [Oceanibaculum pacificum]|uniref:MFS transporter permease n=1 Tax=Oceanibaculum pacificum TaxID=580166 RepID=A0A154WF26_9PROT|nr:organoarsenical effux MFS transporter ArsJ [Oceanibaculum pacificum]KZD12065.1 MFS transporter permease [Oceanibaculum pacificum]